MEMRDVDRLILHLLLDIHQKLGIQDRLNAAFVEKALYGGHLWAIKWELPGVFHGHADTEHELRETCDILDMWDDLERSFEQLTDADKATVAKDADPFGKNVRFRGFDVTEELGRYSRFKGRDLNSHAPLLQADRRMLTAYKAIRKPMRPFGTLTAGEIVQALNEMAHPENRA